MENGQALLLGERAEFSVRADDPVVGEIHEAFLAAVSTLPPLRAAEEAEVNALRWVEISARVGLGSANSVLPVRAVMMLWVVASKSLSELVLSQVVETRGVMILISYQ